MAHFKEQFAIISRCQRIADNFLGARQIQSGFVEEYGVGLLQKIHEITFKNNALRKIFIYVYCAQHGWFLQKIQAILLVFLSAFFSQTGNLAEPVFRKFKKCKNL
jgi:hypothetical protein